MTDAIGFVNSSLGIKSDLVLNKNNIKEFKTKDEALTEAKLNQGSELVFNKDDKWFVSDVKKQTLLGQKDVSKKDSFQLNQGELSKMGIKEAIVSFVDEKISLSDPSLSKEQIRKAFSTASYDQLKDIAQNTSTPPDILSKLANDVEFIKVMVAGNPSAPKEVLEKLAKDPSRDVRAEVAGNPAISKKVIEGLASDRNPIVRDNAKS